MAALTASLLALVPPPPASAANTASIAGTVFNDANGNGTKESAEVGMAAVTVTLLNGTTTVGTTTTSSTGAYSFTKLAGATYTVRATVPSGFYASSANPLTVVLANAQAATGKNFGMGPANASIGDLVFTDANGNGVQDAGELGRSGVAVTLANGGTQVGTTTTTATGTYSFTGLAPATYTVTATVPSGFASTTTNPRTVALAQGQANTAVDFGFRQSNASIGDLVWLDADADGTVDSGEGGIANVRVTLVGAGIDGTFGTGDDVSKPDQTTSSTGAYGFTGLTAGSYRLTVDTATLPAGTTVAGAAANPTTISLGAGEVRADVDFAVRHTGSIGDRVWLDADADATQDPGEAGIAGVTVRLYGPGADGLLGTTDDPQLTSAVTDAAGSYLFGALAAGSYRAQVLASTAPNGTAATNAVNRDVTLAAGAAIADADFGFRWTGSIGDRVWLDTDGDNQQDVGESSVAGVTLRLSTPWADGVRGTSDDVVVATTTSGPVGTYSFENLAPGAYRVHADGGNAPANTTPPADIDVDLPAHGVVTTADFGFRWTSSIGDRVWLDTDGDGTVDGDESGLSGVRVSLLGAGGDGAFGTADDLVKPDQTTTASGTYGFANLPAGTYRVTADPTPASTRARLRSPSSPVELALGGADARSDVDFAYARYEDITLALAPAQVSTAAGNGSSANVDGTGAQASFRGPLTGGVAYHAGTVFVATNGYLRRVDAATGAVTTIAGSTSSDCTDSATPSSVGFGSANAVARLATDGTYVYSTCWSTNTSGSYVRRTSITTGETTTVVALGAWSLTLAPDGFLYALTGAGWRTIVRIDPASGAQTTFATLPNGDVVSATDIASDGAALWVLGTGPTGQRAVVKRVALANAAVTTVLADQAQVAGASGIAVAGSYLYVTASTPNALVRVSKADGSWAMAAGGNYSGAFNDGLEFDAWLNAPAGVVSDGTGLWLADAGNYRLRRAVPGAGRVRQPPTAPATTLDLAPAQVSTIAGSGSPNGNVDGTGAQASFAGPLSGGVAYHGGAAYVVSGGYLRRVDAASGAVTTLAGSAGVDCVDSANPSAVGFGKQGTRLATDGSYVYTSCASTNSFNFYLRRTSLLTGATTTIAPMLVGALTLAPDGFLYVLGESGNRTITRVDPYSGTASVFATLSNVDVVSGTDIAADATALWVLGTGVNGQQAIVKRIALADASVTTVLAGQAQLVTPTGLAVAGSYLYMMQSNPNALVRIAKAEGTWVMAAGGNYSGAFNDGSEFDAWFKPAGGLVSDGTSLLIADGTNYRLRKAVPGAARPRTTPTAPSTTVAANPGEVSTLAGNATSDNVDGTGTQASFRGVLAGGLAYHAGKLYVGTAGYLRKVDTATGATTTIAGSTSETCTDSSLPGNVGFGRVTVPVRVATDGSYVYSTCWDGNVSNSFLRRTSLLTGATTTIVPMFVNALTLAPDGNLYVAGGTGGRTITRVDPYSGAQTTLATLTNADFSGAVDIASDGAAVWVLGTNPAGYAAVKRVSLATGAETSVLTGSAQYPDPGGLTVAGSYLYMTTRSGPAQVVRIAKADGSSTTIAGEVASPGVSAPYYSDGIGKTAWLNNVGGITSDGTHLWLVDSTRVRRVVPGKYPVADGGPRRPGELFGGGNPAGAYKPCNCADPVTVENGNFHENYTDLAVPGRGAALAFTRSYNSQAATENGPLGWGWTHGYSMRIVDDPYEPGVKNVIQENGSRVSFAPGPNGWTAASRVLATLTTNGDGTFTFVRGKRELFDFNSSGVLIRIRDLNGYATLLAYDGSGHLASVTEPAGRTLTFTYSGAFITRVADQTGRGVGFGYDAAGNLTDVTDVKNGNTHYAYDSGHLLLTVRDQRLGVVTNTYDSARRVLSQKDQLNRQTTFSYTDTTTTVTDPKGHTAVYTLDDGRLVSVTRAVGTPQAATTTYGYDPVTLARTATTDPNNHTTTATYDASGNLLSSTDALNHTTSYTYNSLDEVLTTTDATNVTTTNAYDGAGNLLSTSRPLVGTSQVQTVTYTYGDAAHPGDVTSMTDPRQKVWSYTYDSYGNRTGETDPLGNSTTHTYDTLGRRLTTVAPKGNVSGANPADYRTTFVSDATGAVTSVTDPLNHATTYVYDATGNRTRATDPDNHSTDYTFDLAGQLTSVTRPDTTVLTYGYDDDGNRTSEKDAANHVTGYGYDALDRLTSTTDPLNRTTNVGYDAGSRRTTVTDPAGQVTTFGYDVADRITSVSYSDGTTPGVTYTYDNIDRRLTMTDGTGTTTYTWDSLSRLTSSTNGAGATVGHGWDMAGHMTSLVYPGGSAVSRGYDDAGRLTSVTDWLTHTTSFSWDENSNQAGRVLPNGTSSVDVFDRADRLASVDHRLGSTSFASFAYGRSNAGLLTSATPTGTPQTAEAYTYSALDQLKTVNGAAYAYDAADNLTGMPSGAVLAYDAAAQVQSSTLGGLATVFGWDGRGNRTSVTPPGGPAVSMTWDQANRLTAYGAAAAYAYDGNGLRASKTVSGTTRAFTWDTSGGLPLLLRDGGDAYVYGPDGTPFERIAADGTVVYLHTDQLGSVRALTDGAGAVVGTFAWDAYGSPTGSTGSVSLPFGFAGEYRDAESGLVYLRARYYDPATGQFVSVDPAFAVTGSRYGYVDGDPLNAVDPGGLEATSPPTFTERGGGIIVNVMTESRSPEMSCAEYLAYLSAASSYAKAIAHRAELHRMVADYELEQRRIATLAEAAALRRLAEADRREANRSIFESAIRDTDFRYVDDVARVAYDALACVKVGMEGADLAGPAGAAAGCVMGIAAAEATTPGTPSL